MGKVPWRRALQPTPEIWLGESHGQRSLVGYSPWGLQRVRYDWVTNTSLYRRGFLGGSGGKESACNVGDLGWAPRSGRSAGEGNGNPLQHSGLESPMHRGAWRATVHEGRRVGQDCVTNSFTSKGLRSAVIFNLQNKGNGSNKNCRYSVFKAKNKNKVPWSWVLGMGTLGLASGDADETSALCWGPCCEPGISKNVFRRREQTLAYRGGVSTLGRLWWDSR